MNTAYDFDHYKIDNVKIQIMNWDKEYEKDMVSGVGFDITDETGFDENKEILKENGIYSPKYGSSMTDDNPFSERYSCKCGALQGRVYEGETCKECGEIAKFVDDNVFITGWFTLNTTFIIHPIVYNLLEYIIGPKNLRLILEDSKKINRDGKKVNEFESEKLMSTHPYVGETILGFKKNFYEIIDYFYELKKKKIRTKDVQKYKHLKSELEDTYKLIMDNKRKIFQRHIPVYTVVLRPIHFGESFSYLSINKEYTNLSVLIYSINKRSLDIERKKIITNRLLFKIQVSINSIYKEIISIISTKEGHIRKNLLGSRFNNSSRCVIVPLAENVRINEIKLPYKAFLELYKPQIINLLQKIDGLSIEKANERWSKARIKFNKKIYELMNYLIENTKGGLHVLINRNPTINYGSILCMKVIGVKPDINDYTLSVPINILATMGGDFDGDVLNIIVLEDQRLVEDKNELFNPRSNMIISRDDGLFNNEFNLVKDQMIGLYKFCNL